MTTPESQENKLPSKDYILLPLLSLVTVLSMFIVSEAVARWVWVENETDSCVIHTESDGDRYKPNCSSAVKLAEGPWVLNHYNECGYRSNASCGPKPPGTIRIALLGSSFATGFMVPYEQTFAALLEKNLTSQCTRPVEIQNLSATGLRPWQVASRVEEALALRPDVVAIILSPNDLLLDPDPDRWAEYQLKQLQMPEEHKNSTLLQRALEVLPLILRDSRALLMMRHYLYQDPQSYLKIYLSSHGDGADYLRSPYSLLWQKRLSAMDTLLSRMAVKLQRRNIPFVLVPALFYPQVALLNTSYSVAGTDAQAFEREVAAIAAKRGMVMFSVNSDFTQVAHSERLFYTANGHMAAQGQTIFARSLRRQILQDHILESSGCPINPSPPKTSQKITNTSK